MDLDLDEDRNLSNDPEVYSLIEGRNIEKI